MRRWINKVITILFIISFFAAIFIIANLLSFFLLKLGGLEYESTKQLVKFALLVNLIEFPVEAVLILFSNTLQSMGKIKNNVIVYLIGGISTTLIIFMLDYRMESIYIPWYTIVIFSMGVSLLEMILVQKKLV